MSDSRKTKKQLIEELKALRQSKAGDASTEHTTASDESQGGMTRREVLSGWVAPIILAVPLAPRMAAAQPVPPTVAPGTVGPTAPPTTAPTTAARISTTMDFPTVSMAVSIRIRIPGGHRVTWGPARVSNVTRCPVPVGHRTATTAVGRPSSRPYTVPSP